MTVNDAMQLLLSKNLLNELKSENKNKKYFAKYCVVDKIFNEKTQSITLLYNL
jgi:hypothetical protein